MWDDRPPVNWYPDRLKSFEDSQLVMGLLVAGLGGELTREAVRADTHRETERALELWIEEWTRRPWNRFAAFRIADLLIRTDRIDEVRDHIDELNSRWPDSSYVRQLKQRLTRIIRLLEHSNWVKPEGAVASRNSEAAVTVYDSLLSTCWSTKRPQRVGDWLELEADPATAVRGVAVFSAPEFGHGPARFEVYGKTPSGMPIYLGRIKMIIRPRKGWHVMRFDAIRLSSLRVTLTERRADPWTVSEARLITAGDP
jgi:hypothetical protein